MTRAPNGFIAWLRQTRRSAWLLIGICVVGRVGDAVIGDMLSINVGNPAVAAVTQ
ncbi:hypothetical protein [Sphingomonas sp. 37zxx]|uniref:hypothetical protein n=1 Tax=Sphingomonas sp. 37zxx TaxID=1550073 RepID=UPI000A432F7F|nr:hypothetical protein [Sphingomonas sp. 37zxx]